MSSDSFEKYLRHNLRSVRVESQEYERLTKLSSRVPGPLPWNVDSLPTVSGPDGTELRWKESDHSTVLASEKDGSNYLALGLYCRVLPVAKHNLVVWYQLMTREPLRFGNLRIDVIDTRLLQPLKTIPDLDSDRNSGEPPIALASGPFAKADIPVPQGIGRLTYQFPDALKGISEVLVLVAGGTKHRGLLGTRIGEALYVLKPPEDIIEVFSLDWWDKGNFDFGDEWITRVARDPSTGNIVGEGVRILPFLMDPRCNFLGWIERTK